MIISDAGDRRLSRVQLYGLRCGPVRVDRRERGSLRRFAAGPWCRSQNFRERLPLEFEPVALAPPAPEEFDRIAYRPPARCYLVADRIQVQSKEFVISESAISAFGQHRTDSAIASWFARRRCHTPAGHLMRC